MPSATITQPLRSFRRVALVSLLAVFLFACMGLAFTMAALQLQSAARAYITGESFWSKGQQEAIYTLTRYAHTREPKFYDMAQEALAIPLGDYRARLAMEQNPPDREAARAGLLAGNNHPEDIDSMIWLYLNFANAPYFNEAIELWREGDQYILAIRDVGERLHDEISSGEPSPAVIRQSVQALERLNNEVRPIEVAFSNALGEGIRWLRQVLSILAVVMVVIVTGGVALVFLWATRRVTTSESKFHATFHHAGVGMAQMTPDEKFIDFNEALCQILGRSREQLLQMTLVDITRQEDRARDAEEFRQLMNNEIENYSVEKRLLCNDDLTIWCKITLSRVGEYLEVPRYLIAVIEDISEARALSTQLSYQATHDPLTDTINRAEFERRLHESIRRAHVDEKTHTLCFFDLDQFKVINDTCGHNAGDEMLKQITALLQHNLRRGDILARLGGDEFGIIFSNCNIEAAHNVADKLRILLQNFVFVWRGATFNISASLGLVEINTETTGAETLLKQADTACYTAKDQGRNQVHLYKDSDLAVASRRNEMEWVARVREAIGENRLCLYAQLIQPISVSNTGLRYEVLVRMVDTDGGLIMPGSFLPAAERYNVATLIDRWVFQAVLSQLAQYPDHLQQLEACHINLSAQSISRHDFHTFVHEMLDNHAVPADKICLEITETAAVSNIVEARRFIDSVGGRGCHFALDDFGSGLSSFGYLRSLPVDIVKIDGSFVRDIQHDDIHFAMVRSITEISRLMDKLIAAEFVETDEVMEKLRQIGVHYAQGYAIHKPCALRELLTGRQGTVAGSLQK